MLHHELPVVLNCHLLHCILCRICAYHYQMHHVIRLPQPVICRGSRSHSITWHFHHHRCACFVLDRKHFTHFTHKLSAAPKYKCLLTLCTACRRRALLHASRRLQTGTLPAPCCFPLAVQCRHWHGFRVVSGLTLSLGCPCSSEGCYGMACQGQTQSVPPCKACP